MAKVSRATRSAAMSHIEQHTAAILGRAKMQMMILKIVVVLLLAGSGDARPQKTDDIARPESAVTSDGSWKPSVQPSNSSHEVRDDSSVQASDNHQRHLKDMQYIDQSLRTVATQLLNVSGPQDTKEIMKPIMIKSPIDDSDATLTKEVNAEISNLENAGIGFGRPVNSKFGYFETSHPGQAMAMTEEELEKELSSTRLITAHKNHPTTTGGISTWILLNPPSTTIRSIEDSSKNTKTAVPATIISNEKPTTMMERVTTTEKVIEKATAPISTTLYEKLSSKKPVTSTRRTTVSPKTEKTTTAKVEPTESTSVKAPLTTTSASTLESRESISTTASTKKSSTTRTTAKPKVTVSKATTVTKLSTKTVRPSSSSRPGKPNNRRTTVKPDLIKNDNASTAKIEKVTFRPVPIMTTPKSKEVTEKSTLVTKIKASILMGTQKTPTPAPSTSASRTPSTSSTMKPTTASDLIEVPVRSKPSGIKTSNVLKVQLKKPIDDTTKIEIEPIKVNAPVLTIEKLGSDDNKSNEAVDKETDMLTNSKIDLKFDFNPELTKINVDTSTESSTSASTTSSTTTKRPRSTKRKKNKVRRRKPTSTTTIASTTSLDSIDNEFLTELIATDTGIQESKVAPDTKLSTNTTKTKKKPTQKPISTQIYNFLSREVMPSFGVMSLVGLGLGLASYFLYPFGGTIARRNYEIEPKYKYNFDEYGGNYGQREEEVLSKVLQGMTNNENKYPGVKDENYYRYQYYDGAYEPHTTRKTEPHYQASSSPVYRPDNTPTATKYRNTDYRFYDTSTPNEHDRSKHPEFVVGQEISSTGNRQFVVGSVPKEYPVYDQKSETPSTTGKISGSNYKPTESTVNFNFATSASVEGHADQETQTAKTDEGYEEIEIAPAALAVEHGPRSFRKKRSLRLKRDSVIQIIPTKRELEEEEKEEDLSNEILDIIDSALPGAEHHDKPKKHKDENEVEDLHSQEKKKQEEERTRLKHSTMTSPDVTEKSVDTNSAEESTQTRDAIEFNSDSSSTSTSVDTADSTSKNEESTIEWIDMTTKKPGEPEEENHFNLFTFVKKVAEIKFRLGLTLLKHASEGFARYLGHVQKRLNGDE